MLQCIYNYNQRILQLCLCDLLYNYYGHDCVIDTEEASEVKRFFSIVLIACIVATFFCGTSSAEELSLKEEYTSQELLKLTAQSGTYDDFLINSAYQPQGDKIELKIENASTLSDSVAWKIKIDENSRYYVKINYRAISDTLADSQCTILINGNIPYGELNGFVLPKEYKDASSPQEDIYGNQIAPKQILSESFCENYVFDYAGVYSLPLSVNLEKGQNSFEFKYPKEDILINSVSLIPAFDNVSYSEYKEKYSNKQVYKGENIKYQGENADVKSDSVLYATSDKSSASVEPMKSGNIILNTIGGNNWKKSNQYVIWDIEVPQDGLYSISLKYKQDQNVSQRVRRAIYINGEIPFYEAESIAFEYSSNWQMITLGEKNEYLFYFKKGKNEIKLQSTLGHTDEIVRVVDNCITELNSIYRKLLVVLGSQPDLSKDYKLDKNVPHIIDYMTELASRLESAANIYNEVNGKKISTSATLETIARQLRKMNDDSDTVASEFSYFKTNIGSLGTSQATMKQQPLKIDYFLLTGSASNLPSANAGFFKDLLFNFKEFLFSFAIDYAGIGAIEEENDNQNTVKAWITSGRDQAQILRSLASEKFTPHHKYRVNLELVSASSLLPATVAGIGPDVAIGVSTTAVIDYSMRNAAYNLKEFDDFEELEKNYYSASFIPLKYMGGVYALPTSMSFNIMYYRKDILEDLGIEIPKTWNDVVALSSVLSVNNMSFGLPASNQTFIMMLKQNNLEIYNEQATECLLDSTEAIDVFRIFTNFYNNYGFPVTYSLINRFRTGEIPIAVDSIGVYNSLEISAPEIKGLWDFAPVPGFVSDDSTINNTSIVSGTATMLLKSAKNVEGGWEFIKWLSSAEIQSAYGRELESKLGTSGRYTSANKQALLSSCWNKDELEIITQQLESISAVEQVPGGYYLTRNLDNAFRNAVYYDKRPMDVMFDYVYKINGELNDKRKELGLETAS